MYKAFFGLTRNPFELTPDPSCFVATQRHNEALAALYYGVRWHKGFVVVTGEVGTGKTMLLRCLLNLLKESQDISYAYLFNSKFSTTEFLEYILADLGLNASGKNKSEMLFEFGRYLIARGEQEQTTVLIVDEAHALSDELLEEVRLLSNLETTDTKLLQIVLVGQPELDDKLDSVHLRQLKQRIALRAQLGPLNIGEAAEYISRRLEIAGADPEAEPIFPSDAIEAVHRHSKGLPRLINTLCENALIGAYSQQRKQVTPEIIDKVAADFRLHVVRPVVAHVEPIPAAPPVEAQPATDVLRDLFGITRKPATGNHHGVATFAATASKS